MGGTWGVRGHPRVQEGLLRRSAQEILRPQYLQSHRSHRAAG